MDEDEDGARRQRGDEGAAGTQHPPARTARRAAGKHARCISRAARDDGAQLSRSARGTVPAPRAAEIAAFYARCATHLRRIVAANAVAGEATVDDACQHAWAALLRCDHVAIGDRAVAWLATVAIREAWRLACTRREIPVGDTAPGVPGAAATHALVDAEDRAIERLVHAERVADLRRLKPRERRELYLLALGHSYDEIATMTGSSYAAVNRRLAEGRAELRRLACARGEGARER